MVVSLVLLLLLDELLTVLDNNALVVSVNLLTSEVEDSAICKLVSLNSLNTSAITIQVDNLNALHDSCSKEVTVLEQQVSTLSVN